MSKDNINFLTVKSIVKCLVNIYIKITPLILLTYSIILLYIHIGVPLKNIQSQGYFFYLAFICLMYFSEFIHWYYLIFKRKKYLQIQNKLNVLRIINISIVLFIFVAALKFGAEWQHILIFFVFILVPFFIDFLLFPFYARNKTNYKCSIAQNLFFSFIILLFYFIVFLGSIFLHILIVESSVYKVREEFQSYADNKNSNKIASFIENSTKEIEKIEKIENDTYQLKVIKQYKIAAIKEKASIINTYFWNNYNNPCQRHHEKQNGLLGTLYTDAKCYLNKLQNIKLENNSFYSKSFVEIYIDYKTNFLSYIGWNNSNAMFLYEIGQKHYEKYEKTQDVNAEMQALNIFNKLMIANEKYLSYVRTYDLSAYICGYRPLKNLSGACDRLLRQNHKTSSLLFIANKFLKNGFYNRANKFYVKECYRDKYSCFGSAIKLEMANQIKEAKKLYEISCESNISASCQNLGVLYFNGKGIEYNPQKAKQNFHKACKLGAYSSCEVFKYLKRNMIQYVEQNKDLFLPFFSSEYYRHNYNEEQLTKKILSEITGVASIKKYSNKLYIDGTITNNSNYDLLAVVLEFTTDTNQNLYTVVKFKKVLIKGTSTKIRRKLINNSIGTYDLFGLKQKTCNPDKYFNSIVYCKDKNQIPKYPNNKFIWSIHDVIFIK